MHSDLQGMIDQLKSMLDRFEEPTTAAASHLSAEDRATTRSLLREAKALLDESLGRLNEFSTALLEVLNEPAFGIYNPRHARSFSRELLRSRLAFANIAESRLPPQPRLVSDRSLLMWLRNGLRNCKISLPLCGIQSAYCAWFRNSIRRMPTICTWLQPCSCAQSATTYPRSSTRRTSQRSRTTLRAGPSAVILSTSIAL